MTSRHLRASLLALAGLFVLAAPTVAQAQTADDFFDSTVLQEVRLLLNTKDLALLKANWQTNNKYVADLTWRNLRARNISVRNRGFGSRNPTKLGLEISFDRYTPNQNFLGLHSLVLRNIWQDASFMHEALAMAFFKRMGLPASRESYCKLYINNEYYGVYSIVENVDADYVKRYVDNTAAGYLFEYHWTFFWYDEYLGDPLEPYMPIFEARTRDTESATTLYTPIRDLFREVNGPDDGWFDRVNARIDLRAMVRYLAVEQFLSEWDGYFGNWATNNFYLYRPAGSTQHQVLVWDRSESFTFLTSSIFTRVNENVLVSRLLSLPDMRTLFLDTLQDCANSAADGGWLENEVRRNASLITDAVVADTKKQFSVDAFLQGVDFLIQFAQQRPGLVLQEVAKSR
jgi:spore coat protein CotH